MYEETLRKEIIHPPGLIMVCISTHGCLRDKRLREIFKAGIPVMLDELSPHTVLVHGYMPEDVFGEYLDRAKFVRYPSEFERTHKLEGSESSWV